MAWYVLTNNVYVSLNILFVIDNCSQLYICFIKFYIDKSGILCYGDMGIFGYGDLGIWQFGKSVIGDLGLDKKLALRYNA